MKTFYLRRDFTDEVKQRIAEGVFFSDGTGIIMWYHDQARSQFYSEQDLDEILATFPGVELVYAFQTRAPEPKTCKVRLSINAKEIEQYITRSFHDKLDRELHGAGTL